MSFPSQSAPEPRTLAREYQHAAELLASADAIIVAAGAGIGVDSGLPDFRGTEGFWRAYPELGSRGLSFSEVASPQTFRTDPALAWGFYGHRLQLYRDTVPHEGFSILRRWMEGKPLGGHVVTSNVDGQFQKAGFAAGLVREIHGSIHALQCMEPCARRVWSAAGFQPQVDAAACKLLGEAPTCPYCGEVARPNVLMFGDWGWVSAPARRQREAEDAWLAQVAQALAKVVVIEIGAGTAIPSIRHFSQQMMGEYGAALIRVNVREPAVPGRRDVGLPVGALQALRAIDARIGGHQ